MNNNKWIPVSERLPEIDKDVLVTNGFRVYVCSLAKEQKWEDDYCCLKPLDEYVAWQPLPEPYKGV